MSEGNAQNTHQRLLQQGHVAIEVAEAAFAAGDEVAGIAALTLAAQFTQLAKILGHAH